VASFASFERCRPPEDTRARLRLIAEAAAVIGAADEVGPVLEAVSRAAFEGLGDRGLLVTSQ